MQKIPGAWTNLHQSKEGTSLTTLWSKVSFDNWTLCELLMLRVWNPPFHLGWPNSNVRSRVPRYPAIVFHQPTFAIICVAIVHSVLDIAASLAFTHHPQISLSSCLCIRLKSEKIDALLSNACCNGSFRATNQTISIWLALPWCQIWPCHLCTCSHTHYSTCEAKRLHFMRLIGLNDILWRSRWWRGDWHGNLVIQLVSDGGNTFFCAKGHLLGLPLQTIPEGSILLRLTQGAPVTNACQRHWNAGSCGECIGPPHWTFRPPQ